ncbi:MAG: dTDP-4-dehydrorhamnose 3,5-epimerase [Candidatus Marinimicrobia bacterium]|nr:dTDP-4-dehydrorhamnose 3,5-epimerase [Candidatus Neomarinimicrobiota bacterium]MCF7850444.1 dTDP-4-dehydrorhamnose 3,5-epimerase [Candidatus Neomarinimicrobiota bacterium]MCF7904576.1 dTDP-4-dehydrorhamnose 3,5-epimerase [Candidatus Neomarinimicrobiota bacterium]
MKFKVTPQSIPDVLLIEPTVFEDERGYFKECYQQQDFETFLPGVRFVQENESKSSKGVLRGLHFQKEPHGQAKLIRVVQGKIWDVAVDIRRDSPTFKSFVGVELSAENHAQLFIPKGFAHGFIVLSDSAIIQYKTDEYYHSESDTGIQAFDQVLSIPWPLERSKCILSEKDSNLPLLKEIRI